ncbi:hypothetical protein CY34DRAFT_108333 [Suillus luteus UH-Slu-Lm8-n1]|uniref:Uncharacterized protein n=1 Tax=Suillus luteus UH-Slu-Lm8-n1 TaxID=930992 RepID=A0A0D0B5T3_9AGAM|nr:hypothetical protein CY34DRAFT_108333 [Suillus luteus UH-Slu-Lm8-n1]
MQPAITTQAATQLRVPWATPSAPDPRIFASQVGPAQQRVEFGEGCDTVSEHGYYDDSDTVCVSKDIGDHGCVDATLDEATGNVMVTEKTFKCPQCYCGSGQPVPYKICGYLVHQDYLHHNYFPLLAIFLSWSGFGSPYTSNNVQAMLREQFNIDQSRLHIATRSLKAGNNCPSTMKPHFNWLAKVNYKGNLLLYINTHSDTDMGDLVMAGNQKDLLSVPIYKLLDNYIGHNNLKVLSHAIATIKANSGVGPCTREHLLMWIDQEGGYKH